MTSFSGVTASTHPVAPAFAIPVDSMPLMAALEGFDDCGVSHGEELTCARTLPVYPKGARAADPNSLCRPSVPAVLTANGTVVYVARVEA